MVCVGGCQRDWEPAERFFKTGWSRFLNPSQVIRKPAGSPIHDISTSVGLADQTEERLPNSVLPSEEDYLYDDKDYVIGRTDVLLIGIMDLFIEGQESQVQREVTTTGYIDMPLLDQRIKAEELDKEELREAIEAAYSPKIILDPEVSVRIIGRRQSKFSLLGQGSQGTYILARPDTRLLEALAISGGLPQTTIRYIYVMRHDRPLGKSEAAAAAEIQERATTAPAVKTMPTVTIIPVTTKPAVPDKGVVKPPTTALDAALRELEAGMEKSTTQPVVVPETLPAPSAMMHLSEAGEQASARSTMRRRSAPFKWAHRDNKWVKVALPARAPKVESGARKAPAENVQNTSAARPRAAMAALAALPRPVRIPVTSSSVPGMQSGDLETGGARATASDQGRVPVGGLPRRNVEDPFGWHKATKSNEVRIIAINLDKLKKGDPRMNVVIRDNDIIYIPPLLIGEFYMMGEVARPGVYSLTGRRITVKQALAAAGNLGSNAWPSNSYLVRRIGENQEQVITIDIEKIFRGEESDIFLKPEDVIAVGTHFVVPFMSALRGIVPTFSVGFTYSRDFAPKLFDRDDGGREESRHSDRFKRW